MKISLQIDGFTFVKKTLPKVFTADKLPRDWRELFQSNFMPFNFGLNKIRAHDRLNRVSRYLTVVFMS